MPARASSEVHGSTASDMGTSEDDLRASECFLSAMERREPDSRPWAQAVREAWDTRWRAAPCGTKYPFCDCERCAALPEKPAWMASPQAVAGYLWLMAGELQWDHPRRRQQSKEEPTGPSISGTDPNGVWSF